MPRPLTEKEKRGFALDSVLSVLTQAERIGSEKDDPEGGRYIQISDTLCQQMIETLNSYVEHGFEYLTGSVRPC